MIGDVPLHDLVVDVRDADTFSSGHAHGAINLPDPIFPHGYHPS